MLDNSHSAQTVDRSLHKKTLARKVPDESSSLLIILQKRENQASAFGLGAAFSSPAGGAAGGAASGSGVGVGLADSCELLPESQLAQLSVGQT